MLGTVIGQVVTATKAAGSGPPIVLILGIILGVTIIVLFMSMAKRYK
jgi:hypothetical protein